MSDIRRRDFITLLAGTATAPSWPLATRAQQGERMRRIGILTNLPADDPEGMARLAAFLQALAQLGWTDGKNVRIDYRWAAGDPERLRKYVAELVAVTPDVVLVNGISAARPLQQATRTVPIVFVNVTDAVGGGLVQSLSRPGGNATGFTLFEYSSSGKWLELLKAIAPAMTRTAGTPAAPPVSASLPPSSRWRSRWGSNYAPSASTMRTRSSAG